MGVIKGTSGLSYLKSVELIFSFYVQCPVDRGSFEMILIDESLIKWFIPFPCHHSPRRMLDFYILWFLSFLVLNSYILYFLKVQYIKVPWCCHLYCTGLFHFTVFNNLLMGICSIFKAFCSVFNLVHC